MGEPDKRVERELDCLLARERARVGVYGGLRLLQVGDSLTRQRNAQE